MKVSIGAHIKDGPWGGGNLFFSNLKIYLENNNHQVINHLLDEDIDIVLLTDPRKDSESSSFTHLEIEKYKKEINPRVSFVHRINECDERKNTQGLNQLINLANKEADGTVFVSDWIMNLYENQGYKFNNPKVIMSGSNTSIFNSNNYKLWDENEKITIVTHHWGGNWNKGFDTYQKLDELLDRSSFSELFKFTYIGNVPEGFEFENTELIPPLSGLKLASELKKSHIYITGSLNEPSGNHHIEAALCGLPILYIKSGALPEYCHNYGVEFTIENLEEKIVEIKNNYFDIIENLKNYPYISDQMCREYELLFLSLHNKSLSTNRNIKKMSKLNRLKLKIKKFINLKIYNLIRKNKLWN
jgi:hypothetical protein